MSRFCLLARPDCGGKHPKISAVALSQSPEMVRNKPVKKAMPRLTDLTKDKSLDQMSQQNPLIPVYSPLADLVSSQVLKQGSDPPDAAKPR